MMAGIAAGAERVYLPEEQVDAEETRRAVESEGRRALLLPGDVRESSFCQEAVGRTVGTISRVVQSTGGRYQARTTRSLAPNEGFTVAVGAVPPRGRRGREVYRRPPRRRS